MENTKEVWIENRLDMEKFLFEPSQQVKDAFPEITKDLASSHLGFFEMTINERRMECVSIMIVESGYFWFPKSTASFLRDINASLQINRSKNGFWSKLLRSSFTGDVTNQKSFEQEKQAAIFGRGATTSNNNQR
jgi:hypothetical protein